MAAFLLYPHLMERDLWSLHPLLTAAISSSASILMTSFEPNYLPKASPPNTITLEIRVSVYEFRERHKHSVHSTAPPTKMWHKASVNVLWYQLHDRNPLRAKLSCSGDWTATVCSSHSFNHLSFFCIYLFLAALGLNCFLEGFCSCGRQKLLFVAVFSLHIAVASLVGDHRL